MALQPARTLAALGVGDLLLDAPKEQSLIVLGLTALLLAGLTIEWLPVVRNLHAVPAEQWWATASIGWGLLSVIGVGISIFLSNNARLVLLSGLIIVDCLGMFIVPQLSAPRAATIDTAPATYLKAHLGLHRFYTLGPIDPNYGSYFGIASINVNDIPVPKLFAHEIAKNLDPNANPLVFTGFTQVDPNGLNPEQELVQHLPAYSALGVRYIVTGASTLLPPVSRGIVLESVFKDGFARIYEMSRAAPYYQVNSTKCSVHPISRTAVEVKCGQPATIIRQELYFPGWTAMANGRPIEVHEKAGLFQSVAVDAGRTLVEFNYEPPYLGLAVVGLVAGLLSMIASTFYSRMRRERSRNLPVSASP